MSIISRKTIRAPVYVDDILGIGDCKTVEKVIRNMAIKSGKAKIEEIKESVKEGIIERTDEYKYLGWWFSQATI